MKNPGENMWVRMTQKTFNRTPMAVSLLLALFPGLVQAASYFNPAFLSDFNGDTSGGVADLSRFEKNQQAPGTYRVDVYLNEQYLTTRNVVFNDATQPGTSSGQNETSRNGETSAAQHIPVASAPDDGTGLVACLTLKNLEDMGVNTTAFPALSHLPAEACVNLPHTIPDASSRFDFERLRLDISIPQAALSNTARGYIPPEQWDQGIPAILLNYNFTGSHSRSDTSSDNYFLSLNGGINLGAWRLRDTSNWNYTSGHQGEAATHDWQHVATYVERAIIPLKGELTLGDSNTPSDVFDSLSFRGAQLASDDNMLPDSMKGFAPTVRGIAKSNAQVTIKQNGYVIYQTYVPPGAFAIDDLYPTSSSGDLTVSVREADGSVNTYTVPYSSVPILQREGRLKYAVTAGKYRSGGDGQDDPDFLQSTLIWGGPSGFTFYGGTQYAENYRSFALGMGKNLGTWGGISADITQAKSTLADDSEHSGQSIRFLYAKSLNTYGTNFQLLGYRYSTQGFYTLDETTYKLMDGYHSQDQEENPSHVPTYSDYYNLYYTKRGKIQVNISQAVGRSGSLFVTASQQSYWHTSETSTLLQAGYSATWNDISYGINYNYNKAPQQSSPDQLFSFNISVPLSKWLAPEGTVTDSHSAYATYSNSTDVHGNMTQQAGISGTLLKDNNLNYSVQQGYSNHHNGGYTGLASLDYQGTYGRANVSYNYGAGYRQVSYGVSGGVVAHQHGITFSQPLGETNILIAAPGADGVDIENNTGVRTDWRGYAVIPYATDYRQNRVAMNTTSLNNHTDIDEAVTTVVPTKGALVKATFKARVGVRALLKLTHNGKPLPFGTTVSMPDHDNAGIVGDGGQVYLSGLPLSGTVKAQWGEGEGNQCQATYQLPEDSLDKAIARSAAACL